MKPNSLLVVSLIAISLFWQPASAVELSKKAYVLFPVRTELLRQYLFDPNVRFLLLVCGDALVDPAGNIVASRFDFAALIKEMNTWRGPKDVIEAELIFAKNPPRMAARMLNLAILGLAMDMGYERHVPKTRTGNYSWKLGARLTGDARGLYREDATEDPVGDESVRVYPVRSALSRLRTHEADCVVSFLKPFDKGSTGKLDDNTKAKVKEMLLSLKLKSLKRVEIGIRTKRDANQKAIDRFEHETVPELKRLGLPITSVAIQNVK
jgi:hypothetical protein